MKKLTLIAIMMLLGARLYAQGPTLQQKLYYTCKVWGFVKYYHSNVSNCNVNWDSVLVAVLPTIESAANDSEFNDALDTMLAAAGPMALSTTYFPDTLPANLKYNRDWGWIDTSASVLRSDVQIQLDTIRNNFRPHTECWVENNDYTTSYEGWLIFPYDNPELNVNTTTSYPDEHHRLLMFFKYWNVVRYFYPYTYILDTPWNTTLNNYVLEVANVNNAQSLYKLYLKIATELNDVHVFGLTYSSEYQQLPGFYLPYIRLQYVDGQYVVVNSLVAGVNIGDAIISVDGQTTAQWEDSLRPYYSSGNLSVFRRDVCSDILGRQNNGAHETLVVEDNSGTYHTVTATCVNWYTGDPSFFQNYIYPADSLNTIKWTTLSCDIGYVNMGNLQDSNVNQMYNDLRNKSAIIFDIRNYPNGTAWDIANLMYPSHRAFSKLTTPDVTYPGTYYWYYDSLGSNANPSAYTGKVIILMNEQTQSQAEFSCMILGAMPGAVKVGSQTAGADGNVSYWNLSQDLYTGFTTLGVFYPNGDSTQRIGIIPDTVVYATKAGIRAGDDEVLDKALSIAGCTLQANSFRAPANAVKVYPNPATDEVTVEVTATLTGAEFISIFNTVGQKMYSAPMQFNKQTIRVGNFAAGVYILQFTGANGEKKTVKVIKE